MGGGGEVLRRNSSASAAQCYVLFSLFSRHSFCRWAHSIPSAIHWHYQFYIFFLYSLFIEKCFRSYPSKYLHFDCFSQPFTLSSFRSCLSIQYVIICYESFCKSSSSSFLGYKSILFIPVASYKLPIYYYRVCQYPLSLPLLSFLLHFNPVLLIYLFIMIDISVCSTGIAICCMLWPSLGGIRASQYRCHLFRRLMLG